ncbi:MAG: hypothetical protein DHS20C11_10360 [Lysobacteraceae bacterium]|nr:MAG: hypothetical protein DHS20C11_10360 [Xanthomonadaceae bacterium]
MVEEKSDPAQRAWVGWLAAVVVMTTAVFISVEHRARAAEQFLIAGSNALTEERYFDARRLLARAVRLNSRNGEQAQVLYLTAHSNGPAQHMSQTISAAETASAAFPNNDEIKLLLAKAYSVAGDHNLAMDLLQKIDSPDAAAEELLAGLKSSKGVAKDRIDELVERWPASPELRRVAVRGYCTIRAWAECVAQTKDAVETIQDLQDLYPLLIPALAISGKRAEAERANEALRAIEIWLHEIDQDVRAGQLARLKTADPALSDKLRCEILLRSAVHMQSSAVLEQANELRQLPCTNRWGVDLSHLTASLGAYRLARSFLVATPDEPKSIALRIKMDLNEGNHDRARELLESTMRNQTEIAQWQWLAAEVARSAGRQVEAYYHNRKAERLTNPRWNWK